MTELLDRYAKPLKIVDEYGICFTFIETTEEGKQEIERLRS